MATPADKRFHQLTLAIQKAINTNETPVKEKHVRRTIIGTFQEQSAATYWMVAARQPLQDNRIVAWKFCHVTHKLLREGHPACLDDSQRHIHMIENLGKLWVHLREGYGRLINLYSNLLVTKLKFHARNPRFPGNMLLTVDELDAIAENDVNNYFQLCVELFDYMDDILTLQAAVFDSLGNARANSMTASGQCRLAALIPCAQDSSHIYDCNVRLLFRLHASLPPDVLAGHRERFRQQFKKLSSFYKHASSLQYYRNLLTLPVLPSNPPNFLLQSDFGTYVAPVVSIPEPPPDDIDTVGSLIDTSDTISQMTTPDNVDMVDTRTTPSPIPDPIIERDRLIDHLQSELKRMRSEVSQIIQERNTMLGSMREHCTRMESQLRVTKTQLEEERIKAEMVLAETPQIKKKLTETEGKSKVLDEKFQKLKGAYTQLREEHITLIRQKAEVDKLAASLRAAAAQHENAKTMLQQQLNDRMKDVELLQQSASSSEEIEAYKTEITNLRNDLEQSRQKEAELETLKASMEALEIEHKTAITEQEEKLTVLTADLNEAKENNEKLKTEVTDKDSELSKVKEELIGLRLKSCDEYKKAVEEKEDALKQLSELKQQYAEEKEEHISCTNILQADLETFQTKLIDTQNNFELQCRQLNEELSSKKQEFENVLNEKNIEIEETLEKLTLLQNNMECIKNDNEKIIQQQSEEINNLKKNINEFLQNKEQAELLITNYVEQIRELNKQVEQEKENKSKLETVLSQTKVEMSDLEHKNKILLESDCNREILLKDLENTKNDQLKEQLARIAELESLIQLKDKVIIELTLKIEETNILLEKKNSEFQINKNTNRVEIDNLNIKLQNVIASKEEIIQDLKKISSEKDIQIAALKTDCEKLKQNIESSQINLESSQNEISNLKEQHDNTRDKYESTISLKNIQIEELSDKIIKMSVERNEVANERDTSILDKQVLENSITELQNKQIELNVEIDNISMERDDIENTLKREIENLKTECARLEVAKENEVKILMDKIQSNEIDYKSTITEKDEALSKANVIIGSLKAQINDLEVTKVKETDNLVVAISEKDKDFQLTEARLEHTESERLTAECELQDLLQQNTVLEADMASLKIQLEEANVLIKKQSWRLVACAGESALEVLNGALTAFEHSNAQDDNKLAAELAAKAFEELARKSQIEGNEELVAKSAIFAAHNAAQMSAYVTDLSNISTDLELSDKLNNECRSMLTSTKQCLENITGGRLDRAACLEARAGVHGVARAAAAAERLAGGARSVDDELADMDRAIEDAANQIEEMLAASRAGDSGVKLEVNGKILDACTTLMGAVKVLVQDSRKLQNELGDPKTRQKMYMRNPQWSEGLISASKAVVFAAKLLVTSADEAVGAAGRVEGVSAAAHEVAGSTAQLVAASRARAPPHAPALARLTAASRAVAAATGAVVAAVRGASALVRDQEALDTSALSLTATRRLEMDSKVRALELESALEAERARLAALRKRHYQLAQLQENGNMTNGEE